jgi:hypothetical protein
MEMNQIENPEDQFLISEIAVEQLDLISGGHWEIIGF